MGSMGGPGGPHQTGGQVREGQGPGFSSLKVHKKQLVLLLRDPFVNVGVLRFGLSDKLQGDAHAAGPLAALWVAKARILIPWGQEGGFARWRMEGYSQYDFPAIVRWQGGSFSLASPSFLVLSSHKH